MAAHPRATAEALADIERSLDAIDHAGRSAIAHTERLSLVATARGLGRRFEALTATLVGEAEQARSAMEVARTPLPSLLAKDSTHKKEAPTLVRAGRALVGHPAVRDAALAGTVSLQQARTIESLMNGLPRTLTDEQRTRAEASLVARPETRTAEQLARLGAEVLAEVAPDAVLDEGRRLEAQRRRATERRSLTFWSEDGSTHLRGSLPTVEAAPLLTLIDAHLEADRRARRSEPDHRTPEQKRADALVSLLHAHTQGQQSPNVAGDRPRITVVLDHAQLRAQASGAGVLADGHPLTPGELRRLCCGAELIPVVLGGPSEVLDVGRSHRLVTPEQRTALDLRDGGCIFPHCDLLPTRCQTHHIVPWWAGGTGDLRNLCLLCPTHHSLVEPRGPAGQPARDQWRVWFNPDGGKPECIPPRE